MSDFGINLPGVGASFEPSAAQNREELRQVAEQFEAILLRQMLTSARGTDFGGNDIFGGEGSDTFREMRDSQFADVAAKSGQIGFADAIERQLERFLPKDNI